ncbi:unnamed protein product [Bursaphelenchus okinawaensis]|uniref:Uncharacterized protein n=1 Tax=Bursaphelenchus okinawaensis TaxID=465554 RepID=A0A811KNQ0_9BILA|nr:unnamed protein product [Bursaphelenchus okinawaensis]CAG9106446.1 unnamed protein product [Bursaphelenchus okinawaensis]
MECYRIILFYNCLHDLALTLISYFCRPHLVVDNGYIFVFSNQMTDVFSLDVKLFAYYAYIFIVHSLVAVVGFSYIYRYLIVCKNKILSNFQFCTLGLFNYVGPMVIVIGTHFYITPYSPENKEKLDFFINRSINTDLRVLRESLVFIGEPTNPYSTFVYVAGMTYYCLAYVVIYVYAKKVMTSFRIRNEKTKWFSVNKQVANSFIIQAITPSLTISPIFFALAICVIFKPGPHIVYWSSFAFNFILTVMPVINPFVAASCIHNYRKTAAKIIFCSYCLDGGRITPEDGTRVSDLRST